MSPQYCDKISRTKGFSPVLIERVSIEKEIRQHDSFDNLLKIYKDWNLLYSNLI